ncbi:mitochondrial genome maintenance MGM101 [Canariomyces notabilis]|uniref:Mitochondrial genome maintenance protein MGM101 n=1 Tax=Canariomyces notabilis TaxID=2074819 RepID=A0AAN6TA59_9PEZI|nr:mitochondrial genome maintenance MGM101 [Canariomyces arenarius]
MGPPAFQAYRSARLVASSIAASQRASISSKPKPALPRSSTIPPAPAARVAPASKNANHGVIDPQAAIPEASTVADVDPTLAAEIPTSDSSSSGTPLSPAFAAALSGSGSGNGNGNGNGTGPNGQAIDWSSSFHGLSTTPFSPETAAVLMQALDPIDIEIKPDGIIYLPEIKYRRILNKAFGPGGWGLAPRGELIVGEKVVTREYALVVHGRFIAQARGECQYFSEETIPTAGEGCKSNALLRCCKDLGIASELWDPRFIRAFKKAHCHEIWVEHVATKKRRQIWVRKDSDPAYPYQAVRSTGARV